MQSKKTHPHLPQKYHLMTVSKIFTTYSVRETKEDNVFAKYLNIKC
jgi:hypothetical protein